MLGSRPDLCFSISYLGRFQNCYDKSHWNTLKNVVRYVKSTIDFHLKFVKHSSKELNVVAYADSDFGSDIVDRKSVTGFIIKINANVIHWVSKKQPQVVLSSCAAEYIALSTCMEECLFLGQLMEELSKHVYPIVLYEDNQSCIHMAKTLETKKSKHIDIRYNFVKDLIKQNKFKIVYIPSAEQTADIMTKGLAFAKFSYFREKLNVVLK